MDDESFSFILEWETALREQGGGGFYIPVQRKVHSIRFDSKLPPGVAANAYTDALTICGLLVYKGTPPNLYDNIPWRSRDFMNRSMICVIYKIFVFRWLIDGLCRLL